jgi:hypothetical protein
MVANQHDEEKRIERKGRKRANLIFHWFYVNLVAYFGQGENGFGKRLQIVCTNNKLHFFLKCKQKKIE